MCVLLVERKAGRIWEEKRESAERGADENKGERRRRRGGRDERKVGRFPGGPMS